MTTICIYLFRDRVIYWTPFSAYSKPAEVNGLQWFITSGPFPIPPDKMVERGNVSFDLQRGFFELDVSLPSDWEKRHDYVRQIKVLEKLDTIKNSKKSHYTDHSVGQALAEFMIIDEIRLYEKTESLDDCHILKALLETNEKANTVEGLVSKLTLQFESYRLLIASLIRLEYDTRADLENGDIEGAEKRVDAEIDKLRT